MSQSFQSPLRNNLPYSLGRFDFQLSSAWQLAGRMQKFYRLTVWNKAFEDGTNARQIWNNQIEELKNNAATQSGDSYVREVSLPEELVGVWCLASPKYYPRDVNLIAMKKLADHVLFLKAEASMGREAIAEEVLTEVSKGYVPGSPQGFSIGLGAFVMKPSIDEHANAGFRYPGGAEITINTDTVTEPETEVPDSQYQAMANFLGEKGSKLDVLSKQHRDIAGFSGVERRVQFQENGKPAQLMYTWMYPGQPVNGLRPSVRIKGIAPAAQSDILNQAWDLILGTIKLRNNDLR